MLTSFLALALGWSRGVSVVVGPQESAVLSGYALSQKVSVTFPDRSGPVVRLSVCAQTPGLSAQADRAARAAASCWKLCFTRLGLDVPALVEGQVVHLLLREDGEAGGQQVLGRPEGVASPLPWSTIYLFQAHSLVEPQELWREVAHEYGHAVFPAWGPYAGPESWSNGDIGERLGAFWMNEALVSGEATPADAGGATAADLAPYLAAKFAPMAARGALHGPEMQNEREESAYWDGVGLVCYAVSALPPEVVRRGLALSGGQSVADFAEGLAEAVAERATVELLLPEGTAGRPVWVPSPRVKGAKVLARLGGWAKVLSGGRRVVLGR